MFVFPFGLRLKYSMSRRFPPPTFFTFVFTDAKGGHMYAACLRFYEVMEKADIVQLLVSQFGADVVSSAQYNVTIPVLRFDA